MKIKNFIIIFITVVLACALCGLLTGATIGLIEKNANVELLQNPFIQIIIKILPTIIIIFVLIKVFKHKTDI